MTVNHVLMDLIVIAELVLQHVLKVTIALNRQIVLVSIHVQKELTETQRVQKTNKIANHAESVISVALLQSKELNALLEHTTISLVQPKNVLFALLASTATQKVQFILFLVNVASTQKMGGVNANTVCLAISVLKAEQVIQL